MQEEYIHYLWKFQYFNKVGLTTDENLPLEILDPGTPNRNAGPDFINSIIVIDGFTWYGPVEIHLNASDWVKHQHNMNPKYDNVILHIVWKNDQSIQRSNGTIIPTLSLSHKASLEQYQKYTHFVEGSDKKIACSQQLDQVPNIRKIEMIERALFQRLDHKNDLVFYLLEKNKNDWEETAYQLLSRSFGFKINSNTFLDLSKNLPLKRLQKHYHNLEEIEALLLGRAGFFDEDKLFEDEYTRNQKSGYRYLAHKYGWEETIVKKSQWQFFRLQPANFPTIRIAQLSKFLHLYQNIFFALIESSPTALQSMLSITQSEYWQNHYLLGEKSKKLISGIGIASAQNLLINTVVPLLIAFGKHKGDNSLIDKAVEALRQIPPESNSITRLMKESGLTMESAFDSQALIELHNNYCVVKKCLSCGIGHSLLKRRS